MTSPDTGYEQGGEGEEGNATFELVRMEYLYTGQGITVRLLRNGSAVGLLYLKTVEEFEWLKERIDGEFDLEIYQVNIKGEET